jgi:tocopherol O-methyltransferase
MFCPSLGSASDYEGWFRDAGLTEIDSHDWSARVAKTWDICRDRVRRTGTGKIAPLFGRDAKLFVSHIDTMIDAYASGAMRYVEFTAGKAGDTRG